MRKNSSLKTHAQRVHDKHMPDMMLAGVARVVRCKRGNTCTCCAHHMVDSPSTAHA